MKCHSQILCCRFAYVVFDDVETLKSMIEEKQGIELEGRSLFLDQAGNKPDNNSFNRGGGTPRGGRGM